MKTKILNFIAFFLITFNTNLIHSQTVTFIISPASVVIPTCTTPLIPFECKNLNNSPGFWNYRWVIGPGWTLNPGEYITSSNKLYLQPLSPSITPSNVVVSPLLNSTIQSTLVSNIIRQPFVSNSAISGITNTCIGNSNQYSLSNISIGETVLWSSSNNAIATISNPTQTNVTINGVSNGSFNLIATITNSCGQTVTKQKTLTIGKPILPNPNSYYQGVVYGELWVSKTNIGNINLSFPAVSDATSYTWTIEELISEFPTICPSTGTTLAKFSNGLQTITTTNSNTNVTFGNCIKEYEVKCIVSNSCDSTLAYVRYVTVGASGYSPCYVANKNISLEKDLNLDKNYQVVQNPINNGEIRIRRNSSLLIETIETEFTNSSKLVNDKNQPCFIEWPRTYTEVLKTNSRTKKPNESLKTEISIFNFFGKQVYYKTLNTIEDQISITDTNLPSGKYILNITDGSSTQKEIIILE
jgi:hypothetical protein